jgi:hypothetical protein
MIHVEGPDVRCGKASGKILIEEAANAVFAVYETLRKDTIKPEKIKDVDLMKYILTEIGRRLAHLEAKKIDPVDADKRIDPEDIIDRVFGDLLDKDD